ncbi:hypothetical protein BV22DRAFT_1198240 [Leucogyrophana mollusca]|uniref:Uncharacterized protein n=1 Tax=Leucogyrophana mollusca TaxID=85980 RepID=A0ACB8B727_9AGAM|nr:hypothetical protein BV22DRAFT_1198240 [Leucogyrophana mollusca]
MYPSDNNHMSPAYSPEWPQHSKDYMQSYPAPTSYDLSPLTISTPSESSSGSSSNFTSPSISSGALQCTPEATPEDATFGEYVYQLPTYAQCANAATSQPQAEMPPQVYYIAPQSTILPAQGYFSQHAMLHASLAPGMAPVYSMVHGRPMAPPTNSESYPPLVCPSMPVPGPTYPQNFATQHSQPTALAFVPAPYSAMVSNATKVPRDLPTGSNGKKRASDDADQVNPPKRPRIDERKLSSSDSCWERVEDPTKLRCTKCDCVLLRCNAQRHLGTRRHQGLVTKGTCPCNRCGEFFSRTDSLRRHQASPRACQPERKTQGASDQNRINEELGAPDASTSSSQLPPPSTRSNTLPSTDFTFVAWGPAAGSFAMNMHSQVSVSNAVPPAPATAVHPQAEPTPSDVPETSSFSFAPPSISSIPDGVTLDDLMEKAYCDYPWIDDAFVNSLERV